VILVLCIASACDAVPARARQASPDTPLIEVKFVQEGPSGGFEATEFGGETIVLEAVPLISDPDIAGAQALSRAGSVILDLCLAPAAAARVQSATSSAVGRRLAVLYDSRIRSISVLRDRLGPRLAVSIEMSRPEGDALSAALASRWQPCNE
jgi:preprotein translocase subunit SecD